MKQSINKDSDLAARIDYGVKAGVRDAILTHKKAGKSIFILKEGKIVEIPPEQIEIPDEPNKEF